MASPRPLLRPSCEKKKRILWAEWLRKEFLVLVAHRHVVLTIPRPCDPFQWLARMADHIRDPGRHRTLFFCAYANRVRRRNKEAGATREQSAAEGEMPARRP